MDRVLRRDRVARPVSDVRRAIVTGAARGIGEAVAARLLRDGWSVGLLDRSPVLGETAERLGTDHPGSLVVFVSVDVSRADEVKRAVADAVEQLGGVDALVNNAAIGGPSAPLVDTPPQELRQVLEVNLLGPMLVAAACARRMIEQDQGGSIVNLGSIFGQRGVALGAAYCASKGGVALLTQSLALELAPHGIRVNTVAPGAIATEMHWDDLRSEAERTGASFTDLVERVRSSIPLARHGTGDDVAGAVTWLLSLDASYVTGQTINVNGGWLLT
jgi:NAD(P)-dependent dehydrogenase (short-subunit alcohol dehydrogenase family)